MNEQIWKKLGKLKVLHIHNDAYVKKTFRSRSVGKQKHWKRFKNLIYF